MYKKLTSILFSFMLVSSPAMAVEQTVEAGSWPDGTSLAWQCQKGAEGRVKFVFKTLDGTVYAGEFSCGIGI